MAFLAALRRINAAHPWSHNDAYARFVLRHARAVRRRGGDTAVDVGCGTGNLLARLARILPEVVGIEPDPDTAAAASLRLSNATTIRVEERRFGAEPRESCDLVVFVASLHHMAMEEALRVAGSSLRPGGRLVIVGVAKESPGDAVHSWVSLLLNPVIGLLRHPARATGVPAHMRAPTAEPSESFSEIRALAREVLPGIRMRRRLFWRYTASWSAPL